MKKIRLVDNTEIEIYNITESGSTILIDILNADANNMETSFSNSANLETIQYYVGTDLMKGYAGYTEFPWYKKVRNQTIDIDYNTPDPSTKSGFEETKADIFTACISKPDAVTVVSSQTAENAEQISDISKTTAQNQADLYFVAMQTGVSL